MNISIRTLSTRVVILGLVCALWGIQHASARTRTGTISGHVLGADGIPLVLAGVRLMGTQRGAHTDSLGAFTLKRLRPGTYSLLISYVGYHPDTVQVTVHARSVTDITTTLVVWPVPLDTIIVRTTRVKVITKVGTMHSTSASDVQTSTRTTVQSAVAAPMNTQGRNGFAIRSGRATETAIRVDGVEASEPYNGGFGNTTSGLYPTVSPLAVQEVQVVSSGYSEEYGDILNGPVGTNKTENRAVDDRSVRETARPVVQENPFIASLDAQLSTFGIDVDAGSYTIMRRAVESGVLPAPAAVRLEEYVNFFPYDYVKPGDGLPFSVTTELSECPWNREHRLVSIGLHGREMDMTAAPANNLVFLIDVSGSMATMDRLPLIVKAFDMLVDHLRPQDRVSIVVYAGAAGLVLPPTSGSDKQTIHDALGRLHAGGSTAGGAGIELAYKTARESFIADGNNRVILATDGDFNVGISNVAQLTAMIEAKRNEGIFLTTLGVGTGNLKDATLESLADHGNGHYAYLDNIKEARRVMAEELMGTLYVVAKDVKLQVEFNPNTVARYRLIGYENRVLAKEDFENDSKDAGDMGAGHTVTALYELELRPHAEAERERPRLSDASMRYVPARLASDPALAGELLAVRLRYKEPKAETSSLVEHPVTEHITPIEATSTNFRFAAAVAEFGLLLKGSQYRAGASIDDVLSLARSAIGTDANGARVEFVKLAERARPLIATQE